MAYFVYCVKVLPPGIFSAFSYKAGFYICILYRKENPQEI